MSSCKKLNKCSEENNQKLKEAKNLEDLVKIKISTVKTIKQDKNIFWRNLINKKRKNNEDSKQSQREEPSEISKDEVQLIGHPPNSDIESAYNERENDIRNVSGYKLTHPDPIKGLKDYYKQTKNYRSFRKEIKPAKRIVYHEKHDIEKDDPNYPNPYEYKNARPGMSLFKYIISFKS